MTSPNDESTGLGRARHFGFCHSDLFRHSLFEFRNLVFLVVFRPFLANVLIATKLN